MTCSRYSNPRLACHLHSSPTLGLNLCSSLQPLEAARSSNLLLQLGNALLVTDGVVGLGLQHPLQVLVGVVGLEAGIQDAEALAVLGDLVPVALHVLQVLGEVGEAALEDLAVQVGAHDGLEGDVLGPRRLGLREDKVGRALDGTHEGAGLGRVLAEERLVANVEDGAEAAAAQLGELVDAQHLHVGLGAALRGEPLLELDHLDVLQADAGVDVAVDDGARHVHAAPHGRVVLGRHAVVRRQLVDLDLAELADVADALALEGAEVGGDSGRLEVDDAGERLVEQASDGEDGEFAGLGLMMLC